MLEYPHLIIDDWAHAASPFVALRLQAGRFEVESLLRTSALLPLVSGASDLAVICQHSSDSSASTDEDESDVRVWIGVAA